MAQGRIAPKPVIAVIVSLVSVVLIQTVGAEEVLTNQSVVSMVQAGLPETVILAKIRSSQTKFDTSAKGLIALKQAGVPDKVLEAMVTAASPTAGMASPAPVAPSAPAPPPPPVAVMTPPAAGRSAGAVIDASQRLIYHLAGGRQVELVAAVGEVQTNVVPFIGTTKMELVLPGQRASYRITEREPVFLSTYSPSEALLVRLKSGSKDRNLKISSGSVLPFVGATQRQGVRNEDRVEIVSERDANGFYRLRPRAPLEPGEYAFVPTRGFSSGPTDKIYDFGVD